MNEKYKLQAPWVVLGGTKALYYNALSLYLPLSFVSSEDFNLYNKKKCRMLRASSDNIKRNRERSQQKLEVNGLENFFA